MSDKKHRHQFESTCYDDLTHMHELCWESDGMREEGLAIYLEYTEESLNSEDRIFWLNSGNTLVLTKDQAIKMRDALNAVLEGPVLEVPTS